ncbi:MAG: serine hydrolase domain-containing protein [Thermoanaerobaculia bacterium]
MKGRFLVVLATSIAMALSAAAALPDPVSPDALAGLWKAKRWFEPNVRGTLIIQRNGDSYTADIAGRVVPVTANGPELSFRLPNGQGSFRGKLATGAILGHWYDPDASPVRLRAARPNQWIGAVESKEITFTIYLLVRKRPDGTLGVIVDNPERDWGARLRVDSLAREGNVVKLTGAREAITGTYDAKNDVITFAFPDNGGTFDFSRDGDESDFYLRGKNPSRYVYRRPPVLDDGWATESPQDAGIDRAALEAMIQMLIDRPMDSIDTPVVDALLIARHGKLVLEEYFRGMDRERTHTLRSAQKSLVSILAGAVMQAGAPLSVSSPVYKVMNSGTFPADLEPRKRAMTLEHLLTMTSGTACDDWNDKAPYTEDSMWQNQENEPDFYRYALNFSMARDPGEKPVYCSATANLALGMIGRAAGESPLDLFDRLVARPMKIDRYLWPMNRAGQPCGGGGAGFTARDFLKFGQLMLDGGTWNGRRILSRDFATRASSPLYLFLPASADRPARHYGYLWWSLEYPYKGGTVRAFYAGGAGGQALVVIPQLDTVIATFGANYVSAGTYYVQLDVIPKHVLPAVR